MKSSLIILLALFATLSLADFDQRLSSKDILEQAKRREKLSLYRTNGDSQETADQDLTIKSINSLSSNQWYLGLEQTEKHLQQAVTATTTSTVGVNPIIATTGSVTVNPTPVQIKASAAPLIMNATGAVATYLQPKDSITMDLTVGFNNVPLKLTIDMTSPNLHIACNYTDYGNDAPVFMPWSSNRHQMDAIFRYRSGEGNMIGYWGKDQVCVRDGAQNQALFNNTPGLIAQSRLVQCWVQDYLGAIWNTASVYPYSGSFGFGMGTPTFGTHYLKDRRWQAHQWGYIGAIYETNKTVITVGGQNSAYVARNEQFISYNTLNTNNSWTNNSWTISLNWIKYTDLSGANSTMANTTSSTPLTALFDIHEDNIVVPPQIFGTISTALQRQNSSLMCLNGVCYFKGLCSKYLKSLGSFTFNFGDKKSYTIPWNAYFADTEHMTCEMRIVQGTQNSIVIGNAFLEHFYTLYDVTFRTVSIALAAYSYGSTSVQ